MRYRGPHAFDGDWAESSNAALTRHGGLFFVKKTQETPEQELRIARRRMKEVQNG
jgi:hypothetical protein